MATYYSSVITLWGNLIDVIDDVVWLSGKVYKGVWSARENGQEVVVDLARDRPLLMLMNQGKYFIQPEFEIMYRQPAYTDNRETDRAILVSGVGAIVDQIRSNTTDCPYWERIDILDINYKYATPGVPSSIINEAKITVRAKKEWAG